MAAYSEICPETNTESDREERDLLSTHLSGSTADLSIKKAAPCELIELYKKYSMMKNKL